MDAPRPTLRQGIRDLPRPVWILAAGTFVNRFGAFVAVFLVLYLREKGYSIAETGAVVSVYGIGNLLAAAVGGWLADRAGRKQTIAISMFAAAVALLALSQVDSLPAIVAFTGLAGLSAELYRPAATALITDLTPPGDRIPAFALYRLAINAGFAAGPAVAGFLAEESFFLIFLVDAVTCLVFGVVALVALPEGIRVSRTEERRAEGIRAIAADRPYLLFLVASVLGAFVYFQSTSTFPIHLRENGLSSSDYGLLISLNGLAIVFLELPLVSITRRYPAIRMMVLGSLLVGFGFALNAFAEAFAAFAVTVVIWTVGEIVFAPVASAWVADSSPERLRGRYQGAWGLTWGIAAIAAPALGAAVYDVNGDALWFLCGALGVASALLLLGARPRENR